MVPTSLDSGREGIGKGRMMKLCNPRGRGEDECGTQSNYALAAARKEGSKT